MEHQEAVSTLASERYLLGEMTDAERDSFEEHFFSCPECADDVRIGAKMKEGARQGLLRGAGAPEVNVVPIRRVWRPAVAIPWAAAASLAVLAGYQTMRLTPSTAQLGSAVALTPVTLRPATRGEVPVVSAGPGGIVTLAVDLTGTFDRTIQYELRRGDQTKVASGELPAPAPGAPLLVMLPATLVSTPGRYTLVIQNPQGAGLTAEEYRFRVESP